MDGTNGDVASRTHSPVTSAAVAAASGLVSAPALAFSAKTAMPTNAPAPPIMQEGSRVTIEGLVSKPEMNGRTGVICGAFNQESGRWVVQMAAGGAGPACSGSFRPVNLRLVPSHNFGSEWVDEEGRVWHKNVDFSRECAKGHALAPLGDCGGDGGGLQLMCRMCHAFCGVDAASWLMCSVDRGCCGGYAVCCSCARAPSAVAVVSAGFEDFQTLVSCGVECRRTIQFLTSDGAGHWAAVSVVVAVDVGRVAGPHDDVPVLSNVRATIYVAQPRQRDAAADGAG